MKTKYLPDFPERAKKMAEEGLLDDQIAGQLGGGTAAFYRYQEQHREFREALKEGKRRPNEEVEAALFKSAVGYTVQERHVELGPEQKPRKITVVDRYIQPNTTSQIFWLKNRMRDK